MNEVLMKVVKMEIPKVNYWATLAEVDPACKYVDIVR